MANFQKSSRCFRRVTTKKDLHKLISKDSDLLNMNNNNQNLINTAQQCSNYLGLTNRGAISVPMRQTTRYCLDALCQSVNFLTNLINNLQQQIVNSNAAITQRDLTIQGLLAQRAADTNAMTHRLAADAARVAEEVATRKKLEDEMAEMVENQEAKLKDMFKKHQKELELAREEADRAKEAQRNSNKILTLLLAFCKEEKLGVIGFMHLNGIDHFDMNMLESLFCTMIEDNETEFRDDSMIVNLADALLTRLSLSPGKRLMAAQEIKEDNEDKEDDVDA